MSHWLALVVALVVGVLVHPPRPTLADRGQATAIATEAHDVDINAAPRDPLARGSERLGSAERPVVGVDDDDSLSSATATVFAIRITTAPLAVAAPDVITLERRPTAVLPRGPPA